MGGREQVFICTIFPIEANMLMSLYDVGWGLLLGDALVGGAGARLVHVRVHPDARARDVARGSHLTHDVARHAPPQLWASLWAYDALCPGDRICCSRSPAFSCSSTNLHLS
jgi:hypothetical protein